MSYLRSNPDLLDAFRGGSREALADVYRAYLPRVAEFLQKGFVVASTGTTVRGCASPDDLADALQEVFTRAFAHKARAAYDGRRDYGPYLLTIARNVVIGRHRKVGRELLILDPMGLVVRETDDAASIDDREWLDPRSLEIARIYISTLEEPLRAVHAARYEQALSQRDTARQLGISRPKVRKVEEKLRCGLRALLIDAGLFVRSDDAEPSSQDERKLWTTRPRTS